jgi:glycosyltransferase involved in cell wall biosynthesis
VTARRRLSICYAAPGLNLLPSAGPTRNLLSLATALSEWADVTVAGRRILEPAEAGPCRVIAIDPTPADDERYVDDNGTRGIRPLDHVRYCRTLWSFAAASAGSFDVVLEKGWRLSGLLGLAFLRAGVPAALVENDVRRWTEPVRSVTGLSKFALHVAADRVARGASRRLPLVIAETPELKALLVARRGLAPERIHVVGLGVDHALFAPADQSSARAALGIPARPLILLYVGAMDEYHDLAPIIAALREVDDAALELHVVGDGEYRARYEGQAARTRVPVRFHGRVPHASVPRYIATADLCLAPYRTSAFHTPEVFFSTLKIPEYMACARPVVSVPGGAIERLVTHGVNGFVVPNDPAAWLSLLRSLPSRDRLAGMGREAARRASTIRWDTTARRYWELCDGLVRTGPAASQSAGGRPERATVGSERHDEAP